MTLAPDAAALFAALSNPAVDVAERSARLAMGLWALPERGVPAAVARLCAGAAGREAAFITDVLALWPGHEAAKRQAAQCLLDAADADPERWVALARLAPWTSAAQRQACIARWLKAPDPRSRLYPLMFEIAAHFPAELRPHADTFASPAIGRALAAGADDGRVAALRAQWLDERDDDLLDRLARVRTPAARAALAGLHGEDIDDQALATWCTMAGQLPDGREAVQMPPYRGFAAEPGASPHALGGQDEGLVPACPVCDTPAARVLALRADALPTPLSADPSFFWYACGCRALDFATVEGQGALRRVLFTPAVPAAPTNPLVPRSAAGTAALVLAPLSPPEGVGMDATPGFGRHQVGGPAPWIRPQLQPHCPRCQRTMRFLASVDSGLTPFGRLGFGGTLFGFWCDDCAVSTTLQQT